MVELIQVISFKLAYSRISHRPLSLFLVGFTASLNITHGKGKNIVGITNRAQEFLDFGFHGAVITAILTFVT